MADNVSVKITAEVIDLQAKFAIAKAESQALTRELNTLARQAASGSGGPELKAGLVQAAEAATKAQGATKALNAELKAAQGSGSAFSAASAAMSSALGPLIGLMSAGTIIQFGVSLEESAAHIEHEAEVLSLSSVALQDFTESAKLAGVEVGVVETAIRRFNAAQGAAQEGSKTQAEAFRELGVDANLSAQDAIPAVARALLNMTDAAKRARIEQELFGRAGQELNPALREWATGTDELTAKLSAMGVILDEKTTKGAHEADLALTKAFDQFKVAYTPAVVSLTTALTEAITAWQEYWKWADRGEGWNPPHVAPPPHAPAPTAAQTEKSDVAGLEEFDTKLKQRREITQDLAQAEKVLAEARAQGDSAGIRAAESAIADKRKELDSLNKQKNTSGFVNSGAQAIGDARNSIEQEVATDRAGALERAQIEERYWQQVLSSAKLNAAQKLEVKTSLARAEEAVDREKASMAAQQANTEVELARIAYEQRKSLLDQDVAAHRITQEQEDAELIKALQAIEAQELASVDVKAALYKDDLANFQRAEDEKKLISARTQAEIDRIVAASTKTQEKQEFDLQKSIEGAEQGLVQGVFAGRQKLGTLLLVEAEKVAQAYITSKLREVTAHIFSETAKTSATVAGSQARVAAQAAADAEGAALSATSGQKQILQDAAKAAAGAYSAVAGIPYVGPILAPIAAAGAFVAVEAFENLASFDVGTPYVPRTMPAVVHAGERIIPAASNDAIVQALTSGGGRGGVGDIHLNMPINYHAPQDFRSLARDHGRQILEFIRQAMRDGYLPQGT